MPTVQIKTLRQTHASYDRARLEVLEALYQGGREFHEVKGRLLPAGAPEVEPPVLREERLARATYENHVRGIIGLTAATVTQEAPTLEGLDAHAERLTKNADGQGSSLAAVARQQLTTALSVGRAWAWVDKPRAPEGVEVRTLADEDRLRLHPFVRIIEPEHVTNWSTRADGSVEWAIVSDCYVEQLGPLAAAVRVHRWRVFQADGRVEVYEHREQEGREPGDDDVATLNAAASYTTGYGCPLVLFDIADDLTLGEHLHDPAVSLLRADTELQWALYRSANELLTITSRWDPAKPILGHGYYLKLARDNEGADEAGYIGPSGVALDALAKDKAARTVALYRVVQSVALAAEGSGTEQRQSGESKAMDWRAMDRMLSAFADALRDHVGDIGRMVARAAGMGAASIESVTVSGLSELATDDLAEALQAGALAVEAKRSPTFVAKLAELQARKVLGRHATAKDLEAIGREVSEAEAVQPVEPDTFRGAS